MDVERLPAAVPRALTIAGSDSGGGAGIQADLKTFAVLGVWGMSALTSVTVQNTRGVTGVADVPPDVVANQIRAVVSDIGVDAAKTGMLSTTEIIQAVGDTVAEVGIPDLVVDPVFVSKHGDPLLRTDAIAALRQRILPLAKVVTPNLPEASGLAEFDVKTKQDMIEAAIAIQGLGPRSVLIKGGHLGEPESDDLFFDGTSFEWLSAERIDTPHTHGTGCVLSSAIASFLARGDALLEAVRKGKEFVTQAIRHGLQIGGGIGPVSPGWRLLAPPEEQVGPGGSEGDVLR